MNLTDNDMLELLDWRPDDSSWRSDWIDVNSGGPPGGWRAPAPQWIEWARGVLLQPSKDMYGQTAIARILRTAETLHPRGLDRRRLQEALLVLGRLNGVSYFAAESLVDTAERSGIIRLDKVDLWHPGMLSGSGWRTFSRLTLYGKSLAEAAAMPEPFPPVPPPAPAPSPQPWAGGSWFERAMASQPKPPPVAPVRHAVDTSAAAIPNDFVWAAAFVDQQVRKFFRRHWDEYTHSVGAVVNGQMKIEQFSLDFGPKRISDWINQNLRVPQGHPNPCSKQNVNASATYETLVKAFKRNPRQHAVVQRLQQGRSDTAQAILDDFLADAGAGL